MLDAFSGLSIFMTNPMLGLIIFLLVGAGVLHVLSGGHLREALGGIIRVLLTFFTTPFEFLRDALTTIRTASSEEQYYQRTRIFMLFRYSRLQYLGILVVCVLVLSAGATAGLASLYPATEMQQHKYYSDTAKSLREQIKTNEQAVKDASDPAKQAALMKARDAAKLDSEAKSKTYQSFAQTSIYSGGLIGEIQYARSESAAINLANEIETRMADCPYGYAWYGFNPQICAEYKAFATELARRKIAEQKAAAAYEQALQAETAFSSAAESAKAADENLKAELKRTYEARNQVSLFNPAVIFQKLFAALGLLVTSLLTVIVIVWLGAILIDVFNWIILMMRSLEKRQTEKLQGGAPALAEAPQPVAGE